MSASLPSDLHANHATDLLILDLEQLAEIFRTTPDAIYARRKRDPQSLPPAIEIPGVRRIFWHWKTVEDWFLSHQVPADSLHIEIAKNNRAKSKRGRPTKKEQVERALQQQATGAL